MTVLVLLRSLIAAIVLLVFAAWTGRLAAVSRRDATVLTFACGPLFGIQLLFLFAAIQMTGAQVAVVVAHVAPLFVLAYSAIAYKKSITRVMWVICVTMIAGVLLVAAAGEGNVNAMGATLAMACAAGYAAYYLVGDAVVRRVSIVTASGLTSLGSAMTAAILVALNPQNWDFTLGGWLSIAIQGSLMVPIGIGGTYLALRALGSIPGSLLGLLEPIVGVLAALLFLGEYLTWVQWLGVSLVLLASAALPWKG